MIGRGRLIADTTVSDLVESHSQPVTTVRSPNPAELRTVLETVGADIQLDPRGGWRVAGPAAAEIGDLAQANGIAVHELSPVWSSLEDVYTLLTEGSVQYRAGGDGLGEHKEMST